MYKSFGIEEVTTNLVGKTIYIKATLDLDQDSVNKSTIEVTEKGTKIMPLTDLEVEGQFVKIVFRDWPIPDSEYWVKVQKGIKSVLGDELPASLRRKIVFKSGVVAQVNIISPSEHEEISELFLKWETKIPKDFGDNIEDLSYYLEIAKENVFYNTVLKTHIHNKKEILLDDVSVGQYYVRIRAEKGEHYGRWSETVTFIFKKREKQDVNETEPIYEKEINAIELPTNGITPKSFVIKFDYEIEPSDIEIVVTKREI